MPSHTFRTLSFLSVLLFVGCDPQKDQPDAGGLFPDAGVDAGTQVDVARAFCLDWTKAMAEYAGRCGAIVDGGVQDAVENAQRTCAEWPLPRHAFDADAAASCLDQYRNATCTTLIELDACIEAVPGTQLENETCFSSGECVSGLHCDPSATCPGVCRPPIPLGGEAPRSEWCVPAGYLAASGKCEARVAVGETCGATTPTGDRRECVAGAICNSGAMCVAVTARKAAGAQCGFFDAPCGEGLRCDGTCQALADEGQRCSVFEPCRMGLSCMADVCTRPSTMTGAACEMPSDCGPTHFCRVDFGGGMVNRSCQPRVAANARCDSYGSCEAGFECQALQSTSGGTCAPPKRAGERCEVDEQCRSNLRCDSMTNTCVVLGSLGDECAAGNHCLSGHCAQLKCTAASFCVEP